MKINVLFYYTLKKSYFVLLQIHCKRFQFFTDVMATKQSPLQSCSHFVPVQRIYTRPQQRHNRGEATTVELTVWTKEGAI